MTTASPAFSPLVELVDRIATFCSQGKTGNLVLISDDNRMAQMHLLVGQIVFIMSRGRRGRDALPLMRTMSHARMTLDSSATVQGDGTVFPTAAVVAYLKGATEQLPELVSAAQAPQPMATPGAAPARPQAAPQARPASTPATRVTPDIRHMLQAVMVRYIGPMAEIVCDEHFDAHQDIVALTHALAAEIPSKDQQGAFKAEIAKSLGLPAF